MAKIKDKMRFSQVEIETRLYTQNAIHGGELPHSILIFVESGIELSRPLSLISQTVGFYCIFKISFST